MIWQKYKWWRLAIGYGDFFQSGATTITNQNERWKSILNTNIYWRTS